MRRMSRTELIEIIYALKTREEQLMQENEDLKTRLEQREIKLEEAGSIAEAALSLNHIFEDAQRAVEDYISSVKVRIDKRYVAIQRPREKEGEEQLPAEKEASVSSDTAAKEE